MRGTVVSGGVLKYRGFPWTEAELGPARQLLPLIV
jgi:hypothetical protein